MDVRYVNPFMGAIKNVFKTMLKLDVQFGKPYLKTVEQTSHDVSGIIGLSGDVVGTVIVSFPRLSAVKIASTFAGTALGDTDEDFSDAIGELANMIAGNAKKDIEGLNISITTPSVVVGAGHQVKCAKIIPHLAIPCSCPAGSFVVEVGIKTVNRSEELLLVGGATEKSA
ncbi:MAG: chemotaxis protein CheX [Phycisphaerae bacterium]